MRLGHSYWLRVRYPCHSYILLLTGDARISGVFWLRGHRRPEYGAEMATALCRGGQAGDVPLPTLHEAHKVRRFDSVVLPPREKAST